MANDSNEKAATAINRFVARFTESYRLLTRYAALPLVLTPELLNYLHSRFLYGQVPWVAEADLLLSDLCQRVGYEQYVMDASVRAHLIADMSREPDGRQRMQEVARLLVGYVEHLARTNPFISEQDLKQQQWAALVCLDEQRVANEIAEAFQQMLAPAGANGEARRAELLSLANLTQRFAPQLAAHPELIEYAKNISQVLRQPTLNERAIRNHRLDQPAVIAGRTLVAPATLRSPTARTVHEPGAVDIFISYKREEQPIARKLADALESQGWTVWWDPKLRAGEYFDDVIEKALSKAKCVIVVWSKLSVNSEYIKAEATKALEQEKLVPVKIENVNLPFRFKGVHTPSLLDWDGSKDSSDFRRLVENISEIVRPPYQSQQPESQLKRGTLVARKGNRPGDILVFAEEAPNIGLRVEAYRSAGNGLRSLGQFALALDQYEKALALAPDDLESRRQKGLLLGRLKQSDAAKEWLQNLVKEVPDDAESWALLGRVEKDSWISGWRADGKTVEQMQEDAAADDAVLQETINSYAKGFRKDPSHYYSGINAVALMHLLSHLTGKEENLEVRKEMEGGVRWAVRGALERNSKDYWARATLAELEGLSNKKEVIEAALKSAVAVADKDWFKLNSSREQLLLYKDLGFRPVEVQASLEIIDRALARATRPEARWAPRQVFLFSGHMIDAPDRKDPRFPPDKEPIAAKAIADRLDALGAGAEDLAICSGACGGDLLFAEACLARGSRLELRIPFDEPTFLRNSVAFAPGNWTDRFYQVKANPKTKLLVMPDELGPTPKEANPYARDNLWQLYAALSWGPDKVRFICLWNRKGGDGPGGTEHMFETVQKYSGRVYVLDTNVLW